MKRILRTSAIAFLVMLFADIRNTATAQPVGDVSYQTFYDELSPYGRWIEYPDYGYVWCPDEGADFRPYSSNGRWVWNDDYDWMWVSDYSWGWAPFHYGRWFYDPLYGWMWIPGYEWSPAWVAWRGGGDYYGWAPLMPGINISVGFSWSNYNCPVDYWCFAPRRYITSPRIYNYCASPRQNITIINNTTIINNNYNIRRNVYVNGPGRRDVERYTSQRIRSVRVRDAAGPGRTGFRRNNEVAVYRPSIRRDSENRNFAPQRFDRYRGNANVANNGNAVNAERRAAFNNRQNATENPRGNAVRRPEFNRRQNTDESPRANAIRRPEFNSRQDVNESPRANVAERPEFNRRQNAIERPRTDAAQRPEFNRRQNTNERPALERIDRNDRPERRPAFERRESQVRNENRNFSNNQQSRPERRDVFRNNNAQPRQANPQMNRRQEQPRRFESQPRNNGNNNGNRRSFNRDR